MKGRLRDAALIGEGARFVVLTGLSGSGKSAALRALEDLGYYCVENLPTSLIASVADLTGGTTGRIERAAVVVDMRDPDFLSTFPVALEDLRRRQGLEAVVIFLEATDDVLLRRFSETRRPHPMGGDQPLIEGIIKERELLRGVRELADTAFETSDLTVHELRRVFMDFSRRGPDQQLVVTLLSFGYKYGVPLEADLLLDVRFLPNPHFVADLRPLTGRDSGVQDYISSSPAAHTFLEKTTDLLGFLVPEYAAEGKSYLTVGIGCTGGRHRSVMIAEQLRQRLAQIDGVRLGLKHRDIFAEENHRGGS